MLFINFLTHKSCNYKLWNYKLCYWALYRIIVKSAKLSWGCCHIAGDISKLYHKNSICWLKFWEAWMPAIVANNLRPKQDRNYVWCFPVFSLKFAKSRIVCKGGGTPRGSNWHVWANKDVLETGGGGGGGVNLVWKGYSLFCKKCYLSSNHCEPLRSHVPR
jgi:hypothetical protein